MRSSRASANSVVLPDGTVGVFGGMTYAQLFSDSARYGAFYSADLTGRDRLPREALIRVDRSEEPFRHGSVLNLNAVLRWEYRLGSMLMILGAVVLLMLAFTASAALTFAHHLIIEWFPLAQGVASTLGLYRLVPAVTLFFTFYVIFFLLTPSRYRKARCRKWPGALLITVWWLATVEILPNVLSLFGGYSRTYGSLGGVMVALIFFFVVGVGVVVGAELNAALAESGATALKGEVYTGPYSDELEVEEPQPGEDIEPVLQREGPQL